MGFFRMSMWLLTVLTVSRLHQQLGSVAALRPALLLVVCAAAYVLVEPREVSLRNLTRAWPPRILAALGILACISVPFGISMGRAAMFIITDYSKTLIYAALLMIAIRDATDLRQLVFSVVLGTGVLAFMSIFIVGISKVTGTGMFDANDIGLVMIFGMPLTLLLFQTSRGAAPKIGLGMVLLLSAATIAKSQSRGAFVALVATGLAWLFLLQGVSFAKRVTFIALAAGAIVVAAPRGYWQLMSTLQHPRQDYNWSEIDGRKKVAERGLGYMMHYPLFGIGINNFPLAEGTISDKATTLHVTGTGIRWAAAHNSFVEIGAELGVPGLLLYLYLIFGGMVHMRRLRRRLPASWARGDPDQRFLYAATTYIPVSLLGYAVCSAFVSFAYLDPIYILAAIMLGLYVATDQARRLAGAQPRGRAGAQRLVAAMPLPAGAPATVTRAWPASS